MNIVHVNPRLQKCPESTSPPLLHVEQSNLRGKRQDRKIDGAQLTVRSVAN